MGSGIYLHVDTSDAQELIENVKALHTQRNFELLMYRAFKRTGARVKTIMSKDLPQEYNVKAGDVRSAVGSPRTTFGGGAAVSCSIPIDGTRHSIGGQFSASGGAHGWNVVAGRRYKIKAKVVRGQTSVLPTEMKSYGGQPPFRNLSWSKVSFTRKGKKRLPIMRVVGIGIPQMPMNRSRDEVQEDIVQTLMKRIEHEHAYMVSRCR